MSGDIYLFKVVVLGESQVGKSSLIKRLVDNNFSENIPSTGGVADRRKEIEVLNSKVTLHIWDTAGQERFRGINRMYYQNASGALLVFDLTSLESFMKLETWLKEFKESVSDGESILVGNKLDMIESRKVPEGLARDFALKNDMVYIETSAKTDTMVTEAFTKLGENVLSKVLCGGKCIKPEGKKLEAKKPKKKDNKGCC